MGSCVHGFLSSCRNVRRLAVCIHWPKKTYIGPLRKNCLRKHTHMSEHTGRIVCMLNHTGRIVCMCMFTHSFVSKHSEAQDSQHERITQMRPACVLEHHFATFTRSAQWYGPRARQHYGLIKYKRSTVLTPLKARPILKQKTRVSVRNVSRHPR